MMKLCCRTDKRPFSREDKDQFMVGKSEYRADSFFSLRQ